ncbi:MAG: hypothetical protein ACKV19_14820 [Verrucomicrobiales bacterium]
MTYRPLATVVLFVTCVVLGAPVARAHHGPPHDEIDEFESPAARMAVPASRVSWPAVAVSVAGAAAMLWASQRGGATRWRRSASADN